MPGSFENPKSLRFVITLGTNQQTGQPNTFDDGTSNQITLEGFRAVVDIDKGGGAMFGQLRASIFGVSQSHLNSITTLQYQPQANAINGALIPNTIVVTAIDGQQETTVFAGNIWQAWGVYQQPDDYLQIIAQAGLFNKLTPVPPTSYKGTADVVTLMSQLAATMGYSFENNGVSGVTLDCPYLPGTALDQANKLAQDAGIWWGIDNEVLFIAPAYTPRSALTSVIPQVGPQSGLKGYPSFDGAGVNFECFFNPSIRFMGLVQLVTSIPRAAAQWIATTVGYKLESEKPGGAWFCYVRANFRGIPSL